MANSYWGRIWGQFWTSGSAATSPGTASPATAYLHLVGGTAGFTRTGEAHPQGPATLHLTPGTVQLSSYTTSELMLDSLKQMYPATYPPGQFDGTYPQSDDAYNFYRHSAHAYKYPSLYILKTHVVTLTAPYHRPEETDPVRTVLIGAHVTKLTATDVTDLVNAGYSGIGVN